MLYCIHKFVKNEKMKKKVLLPFLGLLMTGLVNAQDAQKFRFSVGPELSFASGSFAITHSVGFGATIQGEIPLQQNLYGTATTGFIVYGGKSVAGTNLKATSQTIIPIKVGIKYFFVNGFYGAAQIGVGILGNNAKGTAFAYTPQIGYEFKTKSGKAVDATFKYDGYSKNGTIEAVGFRLAYIF